MNLIKKIRKGFTLIELVVVIAVIAILSAVSVVAYVGITNNAKKSVAEQEANSLKTMLKSELTRESYEYYVTQVHFVAKSYETAPDDFATDKDIAAANYRNWKYFVKDATEDKFTHNTAAFSSTAVYYVMENEEVLRCTYSLNFEGTELLYKLENSGVYKTLGDPITGYERVLFNEVEQTEALHDGLDELMTIAQGYAKADASKSKYVWGEEASEGRFAVKDKETKFPNQLVLVHSNGQKAAVIGFAEAE